jgi:hypothetical protein
MEDRLRHDTRDTTDPSLRRDFCNVIRELARLSSSANRIDR